MRPAHAGSRGARGRPSALLLRGRGGRDVVPPSHDVVGDGGTGGGQSQEGYAYVARRPLAVVALAEARGVDPGIAKVAVDRLADSVQSCVADELRRGAAVEGAARVVAQIDRSGSVTDATLRVDPKAGAAATAVLCLLSPTRLLVFPPADRNDRGFAIEALWGTR